MLIVIRRICYLLWKYVISKIFLCIVLEIVFILYYVEEEVVGCEVFCDICRMFFFCGKICSIGI